jgi:signal transduction histidine kinase
MKKKAPAKSKKIGGEESRKLNHILETLSDSNQAMIHATNEAEYVQNVCDLIVKNLHHAMVWIGYAENNPEKSVRPVAYSGLERGYLEGMRISWDESATGLGPTGTAIRTGKPAGCKNMLEDPNFKPWRAEAMKRGFRSSIALPLVIDKKPMGSITIYSRQNDSFSNDEVSLLCRLADDLAYGITALRLRAEKDLAEERQMLLQTERMRSEFIADATHELRTPLAIIKGNVDLALLPGPKKADEITKTLHDIDHEIIHMSELLTDLTLITSKGERRKLISKSVNLLELIKEVVRRSKTLAYSRNIDIRMAKIPNVSVIGDSEYLEKMFINLVKNAITYGKDNGRIEINGSKNSHTVHIIFKDNGIGISEADLPRIFERFFRVDKARTRGGSRTGLGLPIAKWIAEAHGGSIMAESKFDKGSKFTVTLPLPTGRPID